MKSCEESEHLSKRVLDVGGKADVLHCHFKSWPDWEVPYDESMSVYQSLISECADFVMGESTKPEPKRLLVHCKAGIGRTGTTLSLVNAVMQLKI